MVSWTLETPHCGKFTVDAFRSGRALATREDRRGRETLGTFASTAEAIEACHQRITALVMVRP